MNLIGIADEATKAFKTARRRSLYQTDYVAWRADVLGYRSYEKMDAICNEALFGKVNRTAIKSSNGTSKSHEVANMVAWASSVFEPGEVVSIISAPSLSQVEKTIFRYVKSAKARASERGFELPGWINESLEWKYKGPEGNFDLAFGRKPATGQEVSTFQGIRSQFGRTFVFFDEAGGMSKNMWTAAEAVLTGADARLVAIGNPDDVGTEWHRIFKEQKYKEDFNLFSISSFELPTFTGEVVYPDDEKMQERMLKSLTQVSWVEHKKRIWGENDARYLSKVQGEFPKDGGNGFFPQSALDKAYDLELPDDAQVRPVLGVDIARWGLDESVIATNRGGRVRIEEGNTWAKCDLVDSARRIHAYAQRVGAYEVRIDSTGVGGGVYDMLDRLDEFNDKVYLLVGWDNGSGSPDNSQWANKRAYAHDSLRTQMVEGQIDLDYDDDQLREELQIITFRFNQRGAIQITPKDEMKTEIGGSPDRMDAVIMAATDMSPWTGNPYNAMALGSVVAVDRQDIPDMGLQNYIRMPGRPLI